MAIFCPYFWFWVVFWIKKTIFCPYFWIFLYLCRCKQHY